MYMSVPRKAKLLEEIADHKVERAVIAYKDRLSRAGFDLFRLRRIFTYSSLLITIKNGNRTAGYQRMAVTKS